MKQKMRGGIKPEQFTADTTYDILLELRRMNQLLTQILERIGTEREGKEAKKRWH